MSNKSYPFWKVTSHTFILGAGASRAAFPNGDKHGKKLPLMIDFVKILQLEDIFQKIGVVYENRNIEDIYNEAYLANPESHLLKELNDRIVSYFSSFEIQEEVTLYDELILSLQKKDAIFSFNWDPLLLQAYSRNNRIKQLPSIHFLHGNVSIGVCLKDRQVGFLDNNCSICNDKYSPSKLIFPISKKNYSDTFIKSEWDALELYLDNTFILTIFGYSAPTTDIEAKEMMRRAWNRNTRNNLNEIQIIDVRNRDEIEANWSEFTFKEHYGIHDNVRDTFSFRYARRSCNAWGDAIMQQDPWSENVIPQYKKLEDLQNWVKPLADEEILFDEKDVPLKKYSK